METFLKERKLPYWLKKTVRENTEFKVTKGVLKRFGLDSVCQSALCPNIYDCFSQKRATFLILGKRCTRNCAFCAVPENSSKDFRFEEPDPEEPLRIKKAVEALELTHVVITSVTRDDLENGGAPHFANCIKILKTISGIIIEVLVPDFKAEPESIKIVIDSSPDIFSHNIETVPRLYTRIRPQADYQRSLQVLNYAAFFGKETLMIKSGLMVGLGEDPDEVIEVMRDLRGVDCDIFTIGQYLKPTRANIEVYKFIEPGQFERYSEVAKELGFKKVASGPFVRSSYFL